MDFVKWLWRTDRAGLKGVISLWTIVIATLILGFFHPALSLAIFIVLLLGCGTYIVTAAVKEQYTVFQIEADRIVDVLRGTK